MNTNDSTLNKNQSGLVSIVVTLIIMIILTLIVVSFARLTRTEQRQILDRQLSTQALYAAETGISDATEKIKERLSGGTPAALRLYGSSAVDYTADCNRFITDAGLTKQLTGPDGPTEYTCLLVDLTPLSLEYSNVDTSKSTVVPVFSHDDNRIDSITVAWQDKAGGDQLSGCPSPSPTSLPAHDNWESGGPCNTGILRVDLVPVGGGSLTSTGQSRQDLLNRTSTVFLYPSSSGGATQLSYSSGGQAQAQPGFPNQGNAVRANCTAGGPKQCQLTITGLSSLNANAFMLRLKSIYKPSAVTVTATRGASTAVKLRSAQAMIDSTGKSNDVLRRVQVRIPISASDFPYPEFALQTIDSLCKRFSIAAPGQMPGWDGRDRCNLFD